MQIVARRTLKQFWEKHPQAEAPVRTWYTQVAAATWSGPADVRATFRSTDFVADNRVIFNIGGNQPGDCVMQMDIRPIKTEADYDWALQEIERYMANEPETNSPDGDRFMVLAALISAYEDIAWPVEALDPIDALHEVMAERGLKPADLGRLIGSRSHASEILNRKRGMTMDQAWKLHTGWNIPAELLLRPTIRTVPEHPSRRRKVPA